MTRSGIIVEPDAFGGFRVRPGTGPTIDLDEPEPAIPIRINGNVVPTDLAEEKARVALAEELADPARTVRYHDGDTGLSGRVAYEDPMLDPDRESREDPANGARVEVGAHARSYSLSDLEATLAWEASPENPANWPKVTINGELVAIDPSDPAFIPEGEHEEPEPGESEDAPAGESRPAWLPEKFATPEEFVAAYQELEAAEGAAEV